MEFSTKASIAGNMRLLEVQQAAFNKEVAIMMSLTVMAVMIVITITVMTIKIAIYCPQGSGTLRQQLTILQGFFFNWAFPEFAKCWPVSNQLRKNVRVLDWPPL